MAGVGVEDLVAHPFDALPSDGGWTVAVGLALYLLGTGLILGGTHRDVAGRVAVADGWRSRSCWPPRPSRIAVRCCWSAGSRSDGGATVYGVLRGRPRAGRRAVASRGWSSTTRSARSRCAARCGGW